MDLINLFIKGKPNHNFHKGMSVRHSDGRTGIIKGLYWNNNKTKLRYKVVKDFDGKRTDWDIDKCEIYL